MILQRTLLLLFLVDVTSVGTTSTTLKPTQAAYDEKLNLGKIDFGTKTLDVDLNYQKSRDEVRKTVKDLLAVTVEIKMDSKTFEGISKAFTPTSKFEFLEGIDAVTSMLDAISDLLLEEEIEGLFKELSGLIITEFAKVTKLIEAEFKLLLSEMKFIDYQESVADLVAFGVAKMTRLMESNLPENLVEFKEWCRQYSPIDLTGRMLERISGSTFNSTILSAYMEAVNFNQRSYRSFENGFLGNLRSLELLVATCEAVDPISKNNTIFNDFTTAEAKILDLMGKTRPKLDVYWPQMVSDLAQATIKQNPKKSNQELADQIFDELNNKYETHFYVGVYNFVKSEKDHAVMVGPDRGIFERVQNKLFLIFRSACEHPRDITLPTNLTPDWAASTLANQLRAAFPWSPLIFVADRGHCHLGFRHDCAVVATQTANKRCDLAIGLD